MDGEEGLLQFLEDVNRLNLNAHPDLHYTILWLKGDKFVIDKDREIRENKPLWKQKRRYHYEHNYKFENDKLVELYLPKMNLERIPNTISMFKHLKKLYLGNNLISYIPESIGDLTDLQYLNLSQNKLSEIPSSICNLEKLEVLNLSENQLTELPLNFSSLGNLKKLIIGNNNIKNLNSHIKEMSNLETLEIE